MLKQALLFAWELPQNLLGLSLLAIEGAAGTVIEARRERGRLVIRSRASAVSLGHFVFWSQRESRHFTLDERTRDHELGHALQSRLLGPLYLPVVGVPSAARAAYAILYREVTGVKWPHYFSGYPEAWADRLGGVERAPRVLEGP
jgi:hypothetical protein